MTPIENLIEILTRNFDEIRSIRRELQDDIKMLQNEYYDWDLSSIESAILRVEDTEWAIESTIKELQEADI